VKPPSPLHPSSPEARTIAGVWWLMFGLAAAVYAAVAGFIVVAATRGRRRGEAREGRASDERFIWLGGIVAPVAILGLLAVVTVDSSNTLHQIPAGPLRVDVVGKRWWWAVQYPATGITTANEIHVPVGQAVEVRLRSDNVVHSFWVPELAGKIDLIPGQTTANHFTATSAGVYRGQCAEFCGLQHANMNFVVIAQEPAAFERWVVQHRSPPVGPSSELEARGQATFVRSSCAGCHAIRGTDAHATLGPDLTDFGGRTSIGAKTVPNDRGHLEGWIADPQSIKPGALMPPSALEPDELTAIVAYLESLK
jgi:cytochrome c oxidase subunit II